MHTCNSDYFTIFQTNSFPILNAVSKLIFEYICKAVHGLARALHGLARGLKASHFSELGYHNMRFCVNLGPWTTSHSHHVIMSPFHHVTISCMSRYHTCLSHQSSNNYSNPPLNRIYECIHLSSCFISI